MKTIRIPTSITDIKTLLLEKFDKDFQVKVNSYCELQRSIKTELERAKNLSGSEIYETFDDYFSPKFSYYGNSILGVDKHINRKLRMERSISKSKKEEKQ